MPVHPSLDRADNASTAHSQMPRGAIPPLGFMLTNRHNWEFFSGCKMGHLDPNSGLWVCSYGGLLKLFWLEEPWISSLCLWDWKGPAKDKWQVLKILLAGAGLRQCLVHAHVRSHGPQMGAWCHDGKTPWAHWWTHHWSFLFLVPTETVMALVTALGRFVGSKGCYSPWRFCSCLVLLGAF